MSAEPESLDLASARLLADLGERVRALRGTRQMTRRRLAAESGVSERYLARLERGRGNISILLLAKVAAALGVEPAELLRRPEARRRIALVGLRGAGKTAQGTLLAERLDVPFVQLGAEIEALAGMSTAEIFALSGPTGYRRLEEKALLKALAENDRCVLETGGGIVTDPALFDTLLRTCFVAWLHAPPEEYMRRLIEQGDVRPMQDQADAMSDLRRIVAERQRYYSRAHASIDTHGRSIEACVAELERLAPAGMRQPAAGRGD